MLNKVVSRISYNLQVTPELIDKYTNIIVGKFCDRNLNTNCISSSIPHFQAELDSYVIELIREEELPDCFGRYVISQDKNIPGRLSIIYERPKFIDEKELEDRLTQQFKEEKTYHDCNYCAGHYKE